MLACWRVVGGGGGGVKGGIREENSLENIEAPMLVVMPVHCFPLGWGRKLRRGKDWRFLCTFCIIFLKRSLIEFMPVQVDIMVDKMFQYASWWLICYDIVHLFYIRVSWRQILMPKQRDCQLSEIHTGNQRHLEYEKLVWGNNFCRKSSTDKWGILKGSLLGCQVNETFVLASKWTGHSPVYRLQ